MKSYKDFNKIPIGDSDIAALVMVGCDGDHGVKAMMLNFGQDASYYAYYVDEPATIGEHYRKIAEFTHWFKIYDDTELVFDADGDFTIYRAGEMGCIIQKCSWRYYVG